MKIRDEKLYGILSSLGEDIGAGRLTNLWRFLKILREREIKNAQNLAAQGEQQMASVAILTVGLYDTIVEFGSPEGLVASEMKRLLAEKQQQLEDEQKRDNALPLGQELED